MAIQLEQCTRIHIVDRIMTVKVNVRHRDINTKRLTERYGAAAVDHFAIRVQNLNQSITPIKTGRLRNSLRIFRNRASVTIRWLVHYAKYVEGRRGFARRIMREARK